MQKILLFYNTIRHLKLGQIFYYIRYRIKVFPKECVKNVEFRKKHLSWKWFPVDAKYTSDGKVYTFIGETYVIEDDWNPKHIQKLWLYNLHYHNSLNSPKTVFSDNRCAELINRWIEYNPPFVGNGWEPYCLSLRITNWVKYISGKDIKKIPNLWLHSLAQQTAALSWQVEYHIQANHLFTNAKALIFAGSLIGGTYGDKWLKLGIKIFSKQLNEQFLKDGAHYERSPMYHSILLLDLLDIFQLSKYVQIDELAELNDLLEKKIFSGLKWLKHMCHPDGDISFFNDSAFGVAPKLKEIQEYAGYLGFGSQQILEVDNCDIWLLSMADSSGYITLDSPAHLGRHKAILNVAPIGPDYQPGHAHADTLSFEISLFGKRVFVNSGTSIYQRGKLRNFQRGTSAHNTVSIDGADSSEVWSGFRVARRARIVDLNITHEANGLKIDASHDGFCRFNRKVIHNRVWYFRENMISIQDLLSGQFKSANIYFYLHPDFKAVEDAGRVIINISEGKRVIFRTSCSKKLSIQNSYWYPEFGKSVPNLCLKLETSENYTETQITWN